MRFLSKKQVRDLVTYSYAHIARLEKAGRFAKRVPIGPGRVAWIEQEIQDWMQARVGDR